MRWPAFVIHLDRGRESTIDEPAWILSLRELPTRLGLREAPAPSRRRVEARRQKGSSGAAVGDACVWRRSSRA